jgi:undecaprenyl pyrophosphate synthase
MWIKILYNFNPSNNFDIEWDNLESQIKEYTKKCQTNGWEILFSNEIIDNASNPHKYIVFVNTKKIELYVVSYENFAKSKNQNVENKLLTHNVLQQIDEFMTHKKQFSHMRQLNNEQKVIGDDIIY